MNASIGGLGDSDGIKQKTYKRRELETKELALVCSQTVKM